MFRNLINNCQPQKIDCLEIKILIWINYKFNYYFKRIKNLKVLKISFFFRLNLNATIHLSKKCKDLYLKELITSLIIISLKK